MIPEFQPWPKISRLFRDIIITEKIDGTNAAIGVTEDGEVYAQSRTRIITPESDNFGFARWVKDREDDFRDWFGPGLHFGEWWGNGIQRGYGLPKGERRFSLFNVTRWEDTCQNRALVGIDIVPVLYRGPFSEQMIKSAILTLKENGSFAAPFMNAEGIVVYHTAANEAFKITLENDAGHKGKQHEEVQA